MPKMFVRMSALLLCSLFLLTACGQSSTPNANEPPAFSENLSRSFVPEDADLAALYNRSCRNCHTIAATRAPLTGDTLGWEPRMSKGMDTLVDNVINGFGGMPPLGMCMDCDAAQFEALIVFMAQGK